MGYKVEWKKGMPKLPKTFSLISIYPFTRTDAGNIAMKLISAYADKHGIKVDKLKIGVNEIVSVNKDSICLGKAAGTRIFVSYLHKYDISEYLPELYGEPSIKSSGKKKLPEKFAFTSRGGTRFHSINDQNIRLLALKILKSICSEFEGDSVEYMINDGFQIIPFDNDLERKRICVEDLHEYELPSHIQSIFNGYGIVCDATNLEGMDVSKFVVVHSEGTKNLLTSKMGEDFFDFIDGINLGIEKHDRNCVLRKTDEGFSLILSGTHQYSKLVPYTDTKNMSNVYSPKEFMEEFGKEYLERKKISNEEYLKYGRSSHRSFVTAEEMKHHEANNYSTNSSPINTMSTYASEKIKKFFENTDALVVIDKARSELNSTIDTLQFVRNECCRVRDRVVCLRDELNCAVAEDDVDGINAAIEKINKCSEYLNNFGKNKIEDFTAPKKEFDVQEFFK